MLMVYRLYLSIVFEWKGMCVSKTLLIMRLVIDAEVVGGRLVLPEDRQF
jgi:hypothetical protein